MFCFISDCATAIQVVFGKDGLLRMIGYNKGFVEMTYKHVDVTGHFRSDPT